MGKEDILKKLELIFEDVFDMDDIELAEETSSDDIEDWNSLNHITLISEIEQAFDIKFSMQEMLEIKDVKKIVFIIEREKQ